MVFCCIIFVSVPCKATPKILRDSLKYCLGVEKERMGGLVMYKKCH